jgi:CRISPR-associated protein Csh1
VIKDVLEVFKIEYETKGDKLILDNYELKEGLYIKVLSSGDYEVFITKKKNRELIFSDINGGLNHTAYEWFKERDYYSSYLNSNKAFYDKKIHNINYLTLFVKMESFINEKKLLNRDAVKEQYKYLCNYKKFKKPQEKKILEEFREYLSNKNRKKDIIKKYRWIKENLDSIVSFAKQNDIKNYIKIFFDESLNKYQEESNIYYAIKIFNDISYSKKIDNEIFGLSDSNMGLNAKKPFLEHKNRKLTVPFMICKDDALLVKKFFDWLKFQDFKNKKPLKEEFFINRDFKEKDLIIDYDYIPTKIDRLKNKIVIKNYLLLRQGDNFIEDNTIEYLNRLEDVVDEVLYNRQLKNNYYGEVYKKLDNNFASLIYSTREAMVNYFKKYDDRAFYVVIKKYTTYLAIEHLKRNRFLQAGLSLNLKFSLLEIKGEEIMNIAKMQDDLIDRLLDSEYKQLSSDEFFYLCGQIARYLTNQSQKHEKKADMLEPYLRANNSQKLKRVIEMEYFKYKHSIGLNFVKFNNAMSLIMAYDKNEKLSLSKNMDSFLIGVLSDNIFYMKSEE